MAAKLTNGPAPDNQRRSSSRCVAAGISARFVRLFSQTKLGDLAAVSRDSHPCEASAAIAGTREGDWAPMSSAARRRRSAAGWRKIARAIAVGDPEGAEREGRRLVLESLDEVRRLEASS